MPTRHPSHLISPDGIRVPVSGAVEAVNLRSRGYLDLTEAEQAQLAVDRAAAHLADTQRRTGTASEAAKQAQLAYQKAVADAEQFLREAADLASAPDQAATADDQDSAPASDTVPSAQEEKAETPTAKPSRAQKPSTK